MMTKAFLAAALGVLTSMPAAARADLKIVATVPDLAAIAQEIGGKKVSVTALALATQDPHFVDAKPSLVLAVNKADLLLTVGLDLEIGWLPVLQTGARNGDIQVGNRGFLDCSQLVNVLDVPAQKIDRSQGDIHPGGSPHYLFDPRAAAQVAKGIAARLDELDPANAAHYASGLGAFLGRLQTARAGWEQRLASARGTPIIAYHKSWVYLADWLGLVEVGFLEPKPGIPPSPSHVGKLLALARAKKVRLVLQEQFYPDDTAKLVAQKIPAALLRLPGGTDFRGGQSYLDHMEEIVTLIERGLGGTL